MNGTSRPAEVSTRLLRIAKLAREDPKRALTTLAQDIDLEFLREAFERTRKDGATGVDGQTAEEYAKDLESNLRSFLDRFKSGTYRAPPVWRVHIPKGDGKKTRPIGIPTFEEKVLQRAIKQIAEWCRLNRHRPIEEQHQHLSRKLQGHYGYYSIIGNSYALGCFLHWVRRAWRRWLARRSQRGRMSWDAFQRLQHRYPLPPPKCVHSVLAT
ncbi:MAG: hypothetical protein HY717_05165 [Planctomycetes bacterium]|nr:hypothetical protein [Planctomycetota bacterium]